MRIKYIFIGWIIILFRPIEGIFYNQPKVCPNASWNAFATTVASITMQVWATPIMINRWNILVAASQDYSINILNGRSYFLDPIDRVYIWSNDNRSLSRIIGINKRNRISLFPIRDDEILVSYEYGYPYIDRWSLLNGTVLSSFLTYGRCLFLFVDINDDLYCSNDNLHVVTRNSWKSQPNSFTIVAGTGVAGSSSFMLNYPQGIHVTVDLDLYVADCSNDRVQLFRAGQLNATTVAGRGTNVSRTLNCPTGITMDADGYLFIVDRWNHRVIRVGPGGDRCIVGCSGLGGSSANQLNNPYALAFDNKGNLFVADQGNNRIQKFVLTGQNKCNQTAATPANINPYITGSIKMTTEIMNMSAASNSNTTYNQSSISSFNQPSLCNNVTWNATATTFANNILIWSLPILINRQNTVVAARNSSQIFIWFNESHNLSTIINVTQGYPISLFPIGDDEILVSYESGYPYIDRWSLLNGTVLSSFLTYGRCLFLFVDINDDLYCSNDNLHMVTRNSWRSQPNSFAIVAGTGVAGSSSLMLHRPQGIHVTADLDLYVADCNNCRVQWFRAGQLNATTVAGRGSNVSRTLGCPTGITMDADGYLFIVDRWNHRVIKVGPEGDRCIVGCSGLGGSSANQLDNPCTLAFDNRGNLFVGDEGNNRIQKFEMLSNHCQVSTTTTTAVPQICSFVRMSIVPGISNMSHPIQLRLEEDLYLSSSIEINCNASYRLSYQWRIYNCSSTVCSTSNIIINSNMINTISEYFLPARTLPLGLYRIELIVQINSTALSMNQSQSIYLLISPSGITANLVPLGTSMITSGIRQDLHFNPGEYSIDPDEDQFNASEWTYAYYCRIYGVAYFPSYQGQLLTIDDPRKDPQNPSCLHNLTRWIFDGTSQSIKSSITILANSFVLSNQTYQWMVRMESKRNASQQATGYVLVRIEETSPQIVIIGCVISTMCIPNLEYQFVNPTTQVSLYSFCLRSCPRLLNITWNIYQGDTNSSLNFTQWTLFYSNRSLENIWFFGRHSSNFTSTSQLFLSFPQIDLWRFEVVYSFVNEQSRSALNFRVNQPPSNGSCSISPLNGTTTTFFTISCPNWIDEDRIKDFSLYRRNDSTWIFVTFSMSETFNVLFPIGDHQLIVSIRDKRDCVTEVNLTTISVQTDVSSNSLDQYLQTGSPTIISQVTNINSEEMNQNNVESLRNASSSGISLAEISVSSLDDLSISASPSGSNVSIEEFAELLNQRATHREYLMEILNDLPVTTTNSLKLQSTALVQLTSSTTELTRKTLTFASQRCLQLGKTLRKMSKRIPFEDLQLISEQLYQCSTNLLTAVNGPLQKRMIVLDSDFLSANRFPDDYDTDLESSWSNPNLFADGNDFSPSTIEKGRNLFYQNQLKEKIVKEMNELAQELTNGLNVHLNVNQSFSIESSSIVVSFVKLSIDSFPNQTFVDQRLTFPSKFNLSSNRSQSFRFTKERLPSFGNGNSSIQTNLSRMISLSILDSNGNPIEVKTNRNDPFVIFIPHDRSVESSPMIFQNVTNLSDFHYHFLSLISKENRSIHIEFESMTKNLSYLFVYRFDSLPIYNRTSQFVDGSFLFCSPFHQAKFYVDNEKTFGHRSIFIGITELNSNESEEFCYSNRTGFLHDEKRNFTSNYFLRWFLSGCFYLNERNEWKSDGLTVGPLTNENETQCFAEHLTSFASSFTFLPSPIDWNRAFSNGDFTKNPTIYLTVIVVLLFYIILMIYSRRFDQKDFQRSRIKVLIDNNRHDEYFYQILVFTGQRKDAGTKSKIYFLLSGDEIDTNIRRLRTNDETLNKNLFQNGNIDSFLLSTSTSLGQIDHLHIWHDNSGEGRSASWFLKCFIVKDLQTDDIFYFISQRWFAVEKDDGKIERLIPVANDHERRSMNFLLTKQFRMKFTDDHLWFSIFSYSKTNHLTRIQRCTCCFLLFILSLLFNILYYDLTSNTNTSSSLSVQMGPLVISVQQVIIGVMIECFVLIPSLFFVQSFRWIQSKSSRFLHVFLYIFIFVVLFTSIFFIIVRGLEFGDEKTRQWLISILTGFVSSIFITQPLKIVGVTLFVICLCRNSSNDQQIEKYLIDRTKLPNIETRKSRSIRIERKVSFHRLDEVQLGLARRNRFVEIQMFFFVRKLFIAICCLILTSFFVHSTTNSHSFEQVQHLKSYLTASLRFDQMKTIDEFWFWLEKDFVMKLRAQNWYNNDPPANLNGFLNDKVNRHIGWPLMKQFRVRSSLCLVPSLQIHCHEDFQRTNEETSSFQLGWTNESTTISNRSVEKSFQFQPKTNNQRETIRGKHGEYSVDHEGFLYEFRGSLKSLQSNLSALHQNQWIDRSTRAILIQMNLYNPNVQLFSSISFLIEFPSVGSLHQQMFIDPIYFSHSSKSQWIFVILLFVIIVVVLLDEIRLILKMKKKYFYRFWSWIELTFVTCSFASIFFYFHQYNQMNQLGEKFKQTNGFSYIDFSSLVALNRLFNNYISLSAFFSILRFLQLCQYHHRLSSFTRTLSAAAHELLAFSTMFAVIFVAFLCLFYFLFVSKISTCSTLFETTRMLFEMSLLKFDAHELTDAASMLGPITFTLFVLIVVFICLSMFLSIINDSFRSCRLSIDDNRMTKQMFRMLINKVRRCIRQKLTDEERRSQYEYVHSMEDFPNKVDRLIEFMNRRYFNERFSSEIQY